MTTYVRLETRPFRSSCPVGRKQSDPCPCKPRQAVDDNCNACISEWEERAAIMEYDGKMPRAEAERLATAQLRAALAKAEPGQRRLFA